MFQLNDDFRAEDSDSSLEGCNFPDKSPSENVDRSEGSPDPRYVIPDEHLYNQSPSLLSSKWRNESLIAGGTHLSWKDAITNISTEDDDDEEAGRKLYKDNSEGYWHTDSGNEDLDETKFEEPDEAEELGTVGRAKDNLSAQCKKPDKRENGSDLVFSNETNINDNLNFGFLILSI
ncbi:unnamed protein product [Orchesella dallaii]|uniref:Uncharacterized protein n=1 Tax=Orchesella dallaii TaxID=48710 RepID=A0ABP1R4B1_9HEXA